MKYMLYPNGIYYIRYSPEVAGFVVVVVVVVIRLIRHPK